MTTTGAVAFGDFEVDEVRCELRLHGVPVKIQPKPFSLLLYLLKNRHRVVDKDELLAAVWPNVTVSEQALSSALRDLRRALGDTDTADRILLTVRGRGVRFVAEIVGEATREPARVREGTAKDSVEELVFVVETELVERDEAMQALLASLSATHRGQTRVSFIRGPTGIGKTRLATELARRVTTLGVDAYVGRCFDGEGTTPFSPWLQIVRGGIAAGRDARLAQQVKATLPQIEWIAPELAAPGELQVRADLERAEARFRLFDATGLFLRRLSEIRPLLLVLDDLQWADEASLLLLEFLVQTLTDARIHIVATLRDSPRPRRTLSRVLEVGARQAFADCVDLEELHRDSVSRLLANAARKPPAPAFAEAVFAFTRGNPLFVSELAKLVARGELDAADARGVIPVPKRARDAIRWQLERLSPACRRLLELASVAGRQFEIGVLSRAAGDAQSTVLERLGEADAVGLIAPIRDRQGSFGFMHDLVRESVYQDVPTPDRVRLHRRIGEALEALSGPDSGQRIREIAYHYSEAVADGVALEAVRFGRLAGEQANSRMAFEDAVTHYDRALSALSALPNADPRTCCELLLSQAEAAWGTLEEAARVQARFVRAADAARSAGNAELLARAALGRTGQGAGPGDFRDISAIDDVDIALLSEAETGLGKRPSELRAVVLARLALAVRDARGLPVANELSREALEVAEGLGTLDTLATVLRFRHEVLSGPQFERERAALAERILRLARVVRSRPLELDALFFLARDSFEVADVVRAGAAGAQADALACTMRHPGALFRSGIRKVLILTMVGAFEKAERCARAFHERDGPRNMSASGTLGLQLIMLRILQGDYSGAIAEFRRGLAGYPMVAWTWCMLALAQMRAGHAAEARRLLEAAAAEGFQSVPDDHSRLGCYVLLADMCSELGDTRGGAKLYGLLLPYEHLVALPFLATICQGTVARGLATLAMLLGRSDEAEAHLVRALAIEEVLASPPLIALTLERYGTFLLHRGRTGDRERGSAMIERASEIAERLGMQGVLRSCQQLQRGAQRDDAR
jgi:DNA-binding winged helix-turn-helix (wHTH) protein/tetratricopeptide (TPR) repeat protein